MTDPVKTKNQELQDRMDQEYKYGFVSPIDADEAPPGLNEDIVRFISAKKQEPEPVKDVWLCCAKNSRFLRKFSRE